MRRKPCCGDTCIKTKDELEAEVDDTNGGFLKHEAHNAYRRLRQGFEALRPAYSCNDRVTPARRPAATAGHDKKGIP